MEAVASATTGFRSSSSDSVDLSLHGVGGHGAARHLIKDPIAMGAQLVMALQRLVSWELAPMSPRLVNVGAFHAGSKHNSMADLALLQLTVRSGDETVRKTWLDGIQRIAQNVGRMNGMPKIACRT